MNISVWPHLCLIAFLAAFQLRLTLISMFPGSTHLFSVCVLCCSVPRCPVTTYCVELNTQQNLRLSEWTLLLSSMVLLSCALSWRSIFTFLILEECSKVGKVFESRHCKKNTGKTGAARVSTVDRSPQCFFWIARAWRSFAEKENICISHSDCISGR